MAGGGIAAGLAVGVECDRALDSEPVPSRDHAPAPQRSAGRVARELLPSVLDARYHDQWHVALEVLLDAEWQHGSALVEVVRELVGGVQVAHRGEDRQDLLVERL